MAKPVWARMGRRGTSPGGGVPPATALALRLGLALKIALGLALDTDGGRLDTGDANGSVDAVFGRVECCCCISGILGVDEDDELEGMLGLDDADDEGALGLESDIFRGWGLGWRRLRSEES